MTLSSCWSITNLVYISLSYDSVGGAGGGEGGRRGRRKGRREGVGVVILCYCY